MAKGQLNKDKMKNKAKKAKKVIDKDKDMM
jgi:hypothetical protein